MITAEQLQGAIQREEVLTFSYPSSRDGSLVRRTVSPYLLEKDDTILKCWDHGREAIRRYAVDRMTEGAVVLNAEYVRPI